ncbi:AlpA family phage regulatory protein [Comamonas sp. SCN 65-56]|uniref:helix-turn-helix transcriptional regulator n=1 Tax=Comamonas sp. SCN 65-56 TaxID=1660095 RepID=UPI0025BEDFB9|nr:AlpA family phage regulatory protein [Comamonas sp. SCN 65-56]
MTNDIDSILPLKKVLEIYPVSRSTWYAGVKSGEYPAPLKLSPRRVGWRCSEIAKLIRRVAEPTVSVKEAA